VTEEIAAILKTCSQDNPAPFVRQVQAASQTPGHGRPIVQDACRTAISVRYRRLLDRLGITRKLTPHDFRRTTATPLYELTGDARDVQALLGHRSLASTIWYLDHDLRPVKRATLELLKSSTDRKEKTA